MAEYEFSEDQNVIINGFSLRLITQSVLFGLMGIVQFVSAVVTFDQHTTFVSVLLVLQGIFLFLVGPIFIRPSTNLKTVTTTEGSDITAMMGGIKKLKFGFLMVIVLASLVIVCDVIITVMSK